MTTCDPDTIVQDVDVLRWIRGDHEGAFAFHAWAGRSGHVAVGDAVNLLEAPIELTRPAYGRYA